MNSQIENEFEYDIVITCYNSSNTIERAINSALNQIIPASHIIIVDDNSQDNSREILKNLKADNPTIKVLLNKINMGQSFCRNQGVSISTSEFVMFLDDDDFSLPERSTLHSGMFRDGAQISFVSSIRNYNNGYSVPCRNSDVKVRRFHTAEMFDYLVTGTHQKLPYSFYIPASTCAVNVESFKLIGGFDILFRRLEDVDFAIRAAQGNFYFSWTAEIGVNRFFSQGTDKGGGLDSKYEIMILNKFRGLVADDKFKEIILYAKLRETYFRKQFFKSIFLIIKYPMSIKIIIKKFFILISRILHDIRKLG